MKHRASNGDVSAPEEVATEQFRLIRLQTFNWGTFSGIVDIQIPEAGYLFVGPSGSGKSTLLDAHTALLTPPKWLDFNVAAREAERHGKDRSAVSYVRGAWAQQTGDGGEHVVQYLRRGTTWSAIAESYRNPQGRVIVLAQVLWIRGKSTNSADVKKLFLVVPRELELRELEFFAESDFDVRRFKQKLPEAFVRDEFSPYQERFRGLLGIDNERALRLLHKTQSAKNLGDLNVFLRDFMLDAPETFAVAERLVTEFGELNAAHQAVIAARRQIETLRPALEMHQSREQKRGEKSVLDELAVGVDGFREQRRREFLAQRIDQLSIQIDVSKDESNRLAAATEGEFNNLCELKQKRLGLGGALLEQLAQQLQQAEEVERPARLRKREQLGMACAGLGWTLPENTDDFVQCVADAKKRVLAAGQLATDLERRKDELKEERRVREQKFQAACLEIAAMERQHSNISFRMLDVRATMADALGLNEERLPFAGELLEVRTEAAAWRGAIERVLNGFAQSLLVDDRHYPAVSGYLNEHNTGQRVVYLRTLKHVEQRRPSGPSSLVRKLMIAPGPFADWLREELAMHFDYECAETLHAFRNAHRAVTKEGQVKHGAQRHEKNDRRRVDDRSSWVLGFDNKDKLTLYKREASELGAELAKLGDQLAQLDDEGVRQRDQGMHCQTLANLSWAEVDIRTVSEQIASLRERIVRERQARPELTQLDEEIERQTTVHANAAKASREQDSRHQKLIDDRARYERALTNLSSVLLSIELTPTQNAGLTDRFARATKPMALDTLESLTVEVVRSIASDLKAIELEMTELRSTIERQFSDFNRSWPAESGGLDPTLASAQDYFGKLARLETDGLPRFEERFLQLLREQSDQNLTLLSTRLETERNAIKARLELVNDSLLTAEYSPGTHLVIDSLDRQIEEVRQFKQSLKQALSNSLSGDPVLAERRFEALNELVKKLGSQETPDRNWRNLVLDVRQHVEFVVRELDLDEHEVEIYRSGVGKSGGQKQKLAATCLAAALRYQLGGQDRSLPSFSTVVLDEAFDKADAEFTTMAMNIFKTFGFQMIVATPLKSVMTLEPFIGGACFVHIKDRKSSSVLLIEYDQEAKRLVLPESARDGQEADIS